MVASSMSGFRQAQLLKVIPPYPLPKKQSIECLFVCRYDNSGQADMKKFENSRNLKKHIEKIRKTYMKEMKSKEKKIRQRATALWVIDHLV